MRDKIKKAMVLAAGYGTRLKPLTDHVPKPLIPVAGKPMIAYQLEALREYGIREVVVNVSHLKEQLLGWLAESPGVTIRISEETTPLETGGGLKQALPLLGEEPFFAINSDIIWLDQTDTALNRMAQCWDDEKMDILLLAQSRANAPGYEKGEDHLFVKQSNTFGWDDREAPYIVASVSIIHPRIFKGAPGGKFSVKVLWQKALAHNRLFCLPHHGHWFQTGTIKDLKNAEEVLLGLQAKTSNRTVL